MKTKGRYGFLLILLLYSSLAVFSQDKKPNSLKDLPMIQNLDGFELALRKNKNNPEQYLYDLITLENNREDYWRCECIIVALFREWASVYWGKF